MKAAFATLKKQSGSSTLSALAEGALGWQDEAGDLWDLVNAHPGVSSL